MPSKVKVASLSDMADGAGVAVSAEGKNIALFRVGASVYAIDGECKHRGGPLAEGLLQDKVVVCPWHAWRFDVTNGKGLTNPGAPAACYAVSVEGNDVFVEV